MKARNKMKTLTKIKIRIAITILTGYALIILASETQKKIFIYLFFCILVLIPLSAWFIKCPNCGKSIGRFNLKNPIGVKRLFGINGHYCLNCGYNLKEERKNS